MNKKISELIEQHELIDNSPDTQSHSRWAVFNQLCKFADKYPDDFFELLTREDTTDYVSQLVLNCLIFDLDTHDISSIPVGWHTTH